MVIHNNLPSVNAKRYTNIASEKLKKASERLSSGNRINSAADDAAGLAVSEKLRTQMRGLKQASRNCQDAVNLVQTFEGALAETDSVLQRCKELAAESANGNYTDLVDRKAIQLEYDQLMEEIDHIADTDFNGVFMLNGNPSISYYDTEIKTPVENLVYDPVYDESGNPVLDTESYRLSADYSGSPFGVKGMIAPTYNVNGSTVRTEFGNGSTDYFRITVNGVITNDDGTQDTERLSLMSPNNDIATAYRDETDANGNTVYICEKTVALNEDAEIKINLVTKATQKITYLTNAGGTPILDENGEKVPISKQWEINYEIKLADDSTPRFAMNDVSMNLRSDTVWNSDQDERYYTSDTSDGFIDHEVVYTKPLAIDSFSSYYFDLDNPKYNDVSNKIELDTGANGPDKVKLGLFGTRDSLTGLQHITPGKDLAYVQYWENRVPVNGVISFGAGSRGMSSSNGDTNIYPKAEIAYIAEIITNSVTRYNDDFELVIQTGTRTKDTVLVTFQYELNDTGDLKPDLNCTSAGLGLDKLSIDTQESANAAIDRLDLALNKITMVRAGFGATQNRLEHKIYNLKSTDENTAAAESGIRDADMAVEYNKFTKAQIVSSAAQSMLAQTSKLPQSILSLIS